MNADQVGPAEATMAQPDPHRHADGGAPGAYTELPDEPAEVIAISGSANEELSHAEMGAIDGDE